MSNRQPPKVFLDTNILIAAIIVGFGNRLKEFLVPTAIISAITYYVGWSANAGYYLRLGLSLSFIQKSVPMDRNFSTRGFTFAFRDCLRHWYVATS